MRKRVGPRRPTQVEIARRAGGAGDLDHLVDNLATGALRLSAEKLARVA